MRERPEADVESAGLFLRGQDVEGTTRPPAKVASVSESGAAGTESGLADQNLVALAAFHEVSPRSFVDSDGLRPSARDERSSRVLSPDETKLYVVGMGTWTLDAQGVPGQKGGHAGR
jgi:hypothetical protein